jgi:hypothetical protein
MIGKDAVVRAACLATAAAAAATWWCWWRRQQPTQVLAGQLLLQELTVRASALLAFLASNHSNDPRTATLLRRWDGRMRPTRVSDPSDVAYTINKSHLYICTHNPTTGQVNDINPAMHVLLHELAHVATAELQHPATFWDNMAFLVKAAKAAGVYEPIQDGAVFCGKALQAATT